MDIKKILFRTNSIDVEKALPDGVVFCSRDGKIQWVNDKAAEIFETSKMHLLTSNIADFIENALNLISNSVILDKPVITKLISKEMYFDMTSKEIEEGYVLDFRDVQPSLTDVSDNTASCNEVNRDKNTFLLSLANDFKSPLQSIVGFSQAMADGLGGTMSEQQEKYIRIIKKNSSDLMYFISKLLELSQTESNLSEPDNKTFDIVNMLHSTVRFNEQLYKDKDFRWNVIVEEGIKNTINSDESIMISISSSSLLLSENDLESMFDPYKIVNTSNRKNLLRAIILACVKNLVQTLDGTVWVESKILKNTSFNIIIPVNKG